MAWPWQRTPDRQRLAVQLTPEHLAYACADAEGRVTRSGVLARGNDTPAAFAGRIRELWLPARGGCLVLPLADSQFVQIEAPAVKPEEQKAAARWRVKDLLDGRLDELLLDVMVVGPDRPRPNRQLFIAAATTRVVEQTLATLAEAGLEPAVVDVPETAQRDLQHGVACAVGFGERATAALVRHGDHALLTICAGGELYHARRLEWSAVPWERTAVAATSMPMALQYANEAGTPDYVDYGAEPDAHGADATAAEAPRLVIELQRSFDLWDRSWPSLPIAALWVHAGEVSGEMATVLGASLGQSVGVLDPALALPGFEQATAATGVRSAVLPLAGALRRGTPGSR